MKKILFSLCCLIGSVCLAQTPATLLDINNPEITGASVVKTFTGEPAVLIEKGQKEEPAVNQAERVAPPDLRGNLAQVQIQTPFGHEQTAAFVTHAPDYNVFIQVMDDKTVRITEQIQIVNTDNQFQFKRSFPASIVDKDGNQLKQNIVVLSLKRNGFPVPFSQEVVDGRLIVKDTHVVSLGAHHWTLEYLSNDSVMNRSSLGDITLSLTGGDWPFITERFSAVLLWPVKTNFYTQEILFGNNNVTVPGQVKSYQDIAGNTVFQMTRPIPAYTDIRLHLRFDAKTLPAAEQHIAVSDIIILIFILVLIGYTWLSIVSCRAKKEKRPLNKSVDLSVLLWSKAIDKKLPKSFLKKVNKEYGIHIDFFALIDHDYTLKALSFIKFNIEYIIGVLLLIIGMKYVLLHWGLILGAEVTLFFLALGCVAVFIIHHFGTKVVLLRLDKELKDAILNTPHGLHPTPREVGLYYVLTTCLGIEKEWEEQMLLNNPKYKKLPFFNTGSSQNDK